MQLVLWEHDRKADREWLLENARGAVALAVTLVDQVYNYKYRITHLIVLRRSIKSLSMPPARPSKWCQRCEPYCYHETRLLTLPKVCWLW